MASRREREVIDRCDKIIRLCGAWPGLWQTHDPAAAPPYAPGALRHVSDAIASLRHEDWEAADECLTAAERDVARYVAEGPAGHSEQQRAQLHSVPKVHDPDPDGAQGAAPGVAHVGG